MRKGLTGSCQENLGYLLFVNYLFTAQKGKLAICLKRLLTWLEFRDDEWGCQGAASLFGAGTGPARADSYDAISPASAQNENFSTLLIQDKIHIKDILDLTLVKNILALSSLYVTRSHDCQRILSLALTTWPDKNSKSQNLSQD